MDEYVTTSSRRIFHMGAILFENKLCLTETNSKKSFLSIDLKDSFRSLNELPLIQDTGPFCSLKISIRSPLIRLSLSESSLACEVFRTMINIDKVIKP